MITKELLLEKFNISEDQIIDSGLSLEELNDIANDFEHSKHEKYQNVMKNFVEKYLENTETARIHSYRARVKDPIHLIVKIIRRKQENYKKYEKLNKSNNEKFVTDLIGIRCFVLFKAEWENFHTFILENFENNVECYVNDCISDFDEDETHIYLAEKPKAHIRNGDARDIYEKLLSPDSVIDDKIYRSVHYIIKYQGVYLEIQVRTLFEEGWGEVDHAILYPYYQKDPIFREYTELLNRLSGLADEMSSFFTKLKRLELEHLKCNDVVELVTEKEEKVVKSSATNMKTAQTELKYNESMSVRTPNDCLQSILGE